MAIIAKKSMVVLYTGDNDVYSHRTRIVLAEKGIAVDTINSQHMENQPEEIADLNPYGTLPILVDRELVLYESHIIMEYLEERYPHPPLLPVYPVQRAKYRLMMSRIERDWYSLFHAIEKTTDQKLLQQYRKSLLENLLGLKIMLEQTPYFLSNEFTLMDCYMAPLLWRLPVLGIELPKSAGILMNYAERLFSRPSFRKSLTESENEIRSPLEEAS
ncbi:MAG: glutathione S-transferase N-terminal domain-containing protein [Pseudomonadota bacterium]